MNLQPTSSVGGIPVWLQITLILLVPILTVVTRVLYDWLVERETQTIATEINFNTIAQLATVLITSLVLSTALPQRGRSLGVGFFLIVLLLDLLLIQGAIYSVFKDKTDKKIDAALDIVLPPAQGNEQLRTAARNIGYLVIKPDIVPESPISKFFGSPYRVKRELYSELLWRMSGNQNPQIKEQVLEQLQPERKRNVTLVQGVVLFVALFLFVFGTASAVGLLQF